jgi:hypothetical protein
MFEANCGADFGAALLLVYAIVDGAKNAPVRLGEFMPEKLLSQLDDERKRII